MISDTITTAPPADVVEPVTFKVEDGGGLNAQQSCFTDGVYLGVASRNEVAPSFAAVWLNIEETVALRNLLNRIIDNVLREEA